MNHSSTRTNTLPTKLKMERSMPKWVTEANDRIGPKPPAPPPSAATNGGASIFRPPALPPKKNQPEPDYEVIEFSGQQYSNEPTTIAMRPKTPDARRPESAMKCTLCGSNSPWVTCDECAQQIFCASCDDMFHKHPKRKTHLRKAIEPKRGSTPLIPPKALNPTAPVAPPRRNKRGMPSPMPLRRDQVIGSTATTPSVSPVPGSHQQQQPGWQDRLGSLRRGLNLGNRPLPETPRTPSDGVSSRSTTPNSKSVFDQIQKPPSITLEKIKTKASATLDRMALLQQRYRQHKQSKPNDKTNGQSEQQMSMGGMRGQGPSARNMSSSVFNLNQMSQRHNRDNQSPMWMGVGSQMQQAQSMAQLNCINCHSHGGWNQSHQQSQDWPGAANSNLNRSNMSLNVTHGFYPSHPNQHMMHAQPVFMNMPGMYPYPMGMPVTAMNPGMMGMPLPGRSRAASRASSRVPSPTHSRKSMQVRSKKRNDFSENELTDDEDSDNDDRRSLMSQRSGLANTRRTRRVSSVSQALEQEEPRSLRSKAMSSRDRRGPSMPKSVQDEWTPSRRPSIVSNANSNFNSYRKVYSDSPISPDSEASEAPPTRALVQAKIQEKMKESSSKTKPKPLVLSDNEEITQLPEPKSPIEVEQVEYQNGNDLKQSEKPTPNTTLPDDSSSLGPPPSTPEHEWECEFCTFVNEPKTKICSICCKTPKEAPQKVVPKPAASSAKVTTSTTTTASVTNGIAKLKISHPTEDESEDYTAAAKKKDVEPIEDIWATLDENIQAEAKKAKRNAETAIEYKKAKDQQESEISRASSSVAKEKKPEKVSTGCGPSPPKEIPRELRSTATSPVPQTYDTVPKRNEEKHFKTAETSTEMPTNDFQNHSFTPPTRNFSPKEMFPPILPEPSTSREVENLAFMDRNLRFYREMPTDRYRSSTDIRSSDLSPMHQATRPQIPDYVSMQKEAEHYKFTAEELHAALKNCGDTHPIVWLRENWSKLVQTVQSLATKYGQERIENVIGTISAIEAREALRLHGGNVWQAISECVEQRQRKYLEISAKGNYSREDIVTALTAHHGNMDLALLDLSKTQLKPFLMRVWGSPGGVENESANFMPSPPAPKSEISSPIHEFLAANAEQIALTQDQASYRNASSIYSQFETKDDSFSSQSNNKNVLKDLEILIGNMEQVQAKQNSQVLRSMEDMLGNLLAKKPLEAELDSEAERIFMKSPIYSNRNITNSSTSSAGDDVKNFVWQHIQDIVPNLVEQVERDLLEPSPPVHEVEEAIRLVEPPPIDADEFLMEEVIKPNLKHSTEEEEPEVELEDVKMMEDFKSDGDKGLLRKQKEEYEFKSFKNAPRQVYKMEIAPQLSSEEESSEEESSEEEDSQEEISSRDTQNRSMANKNAESITKSTTVMIVKTDQQSSSPVLKTLTDETLSQSKKEDSPSTINVQENVDSRDTNNQNIEEPDEPIIEESNAEAKKDKSQSYRGFTFRFGFNSSRRNRRPVRTRRSIKREKKNVEIESEEHESKEEVLQNQGSAKETEPSESKAESTLAHISNKEIKTEGQLSKPAETVLVERLQVSSLQNEIIESESVKQTAPNQVKQQQNPAISDMKINKNVKKRSNIPSRSNSKQSKDTKLTAPKTQSNEAYDEAKSIHILNTENETSQFENSTKTADNLLRNLDNSKTEVEPELESSRQQTASESSEMHMHSADSDSKPSTSSSPKKSLLKKPKARNTAKESTYSKPQEMKPIDDGNSSTPSTSFQSSGPQKINDIGSSMSGESVKVINDTKFELSSSNLNVSNEENLDVKANVERKSTAFGEGSRDKTNETIILQESLINEETLASSTSKKKTTSKIPVRRTTSSTSLKSIESNSNSLTPTPTLTPTTHSSKSPFNFEKSTEKDQKGFSTEDDELYQDVQSSSDEENEPNFFNAIEDEIQPTIASSADNNSVSKEDEDNSDQELFSIGSEEPNTLSTRDLMQSPTSENEVLLILENQSFSQHSTTITPVSSSKSIDFKYSDPSKQNLSELVEDTQRLIKQMKEEINIDMAAYDSEDDDDEDYSEDYSYEEYEDEYEEDEEDNSEEFEEEETENDEEYSNADLVDSDDDGNRNDILEDVQEETAQEQIEMNVDEELQSLVHTPSTDHSSLVVVETSGFNNATHLADTDLNTVSVVSGVPIEAEKQSDISSTNSEIVAEPGLSETVLENDLPIELESVENDTSVVKGLKQLQSEMKKVLQSESQSSDITDSVTADISMEDNKPSTSKSTKSFKDKRLVEQVPKKSSQDPQIISKRIKQIENTISEDRIEEKATEITKEISKTEPIVETSTNIVNLLPSESLNKDAEAENEEAIINERRTFLETKSTELNTKISERPEDQKDSFKPNKIFEIHEPSTSRSSPELRRVEAILKEGKTDSEIKSTEFPQSSVNREEPEGPVLVPEMNEPFSSTSNGITVKQKENQEGAETRTQDLEAIEPSSSNAVQSGPQHMREEILEDIVKNSNFENGNENMEVSILKDESQQITSNPMDELLTVSSNDPKTSNTQVDESRLENPLPKDSPQSSSAQKYPNSKDLQEKSKALDNYSTNDEKDNVPGTSKNSAARKSPPKKPVSKIPKPKFNSKPTPTSTRSKSFSAPSPIGVSSVRAIQQELFNKQAQVAKTPGFTSQKPTPPKLVRKKSITDAISRFSQVTSEHTVQRSRTQPKIPKIPKKKYHETCFSDDDYQGSSSEDEEPQPVETRLRKQSAPVFRTYASIKELQVEQPEVCARRLIDEQLVSNMAEAQIAAALVGMRFQQDVSIWAAKECCDLDQAISLLQQECELCMGSYPMNQIVSMLKCTHKCCKQCAKNYFTIQITDRSINDCNCPFCKTPELHDPNVLEDENLEYFSNLDIFIKNIVEPEVHELFQRKLRDRTLMQDPNFKWCIQCSSGFFARPKQKRLICPDCGSVTCSQCRKTWEKQHEGLTCEKFQEWKDANDPEIQAKGVAEHLALNGIDCPKCHFKYSLARGGCMHFTCTQCKFEFCYGCGRPFMMGAKCTVSPYCSKLGLHSHHPRSCLFYLRDKEPHTLQNLLLQNDIPFDIDPIGSEGGAKSALSKCPIPLQKETPKGLVDTVCNTDVQNDHAGLCRQHYVEYLANKVSKASIDPLPILDLTDCVQELRRRGLPLPERGPWDTDEIYRDMCSKIIKEKIPL